MKKAKFFSVILSAALAATCLVGCGDSNPATPSKADSDGLHFEIVSKGFQHQYWQAVLKGAESKAAELGDTINFVGPNSESDIADQVQMLQSAINAKPDGIGLAALDTSACLDAITAAQAAGIPIVGFDSGVPGAPDGAIVANAATDNYVAGAMAADETYKLIKGNIKAGAVIGVLSQDATSESIVNRGLGFVDKMAELVVAQGLTVSVEGNERFVSDTKAKVTAGADVVIKVLVPSQVTSELSSIDCTNLLNEKGIIAVYGSNQHSAEAMVTANENLGKFGKDVVGVGFDSGAVVKAAVADGTLAGAITQAPVSIGENVVNLLHQAATGNAVSDVDTGCQWYTAENMNNAEISQNLYD